MQETPRFSHSYDTLRAIAEDILAEARKGGATACEAEVTEGFGQSVTVRRGEVETVEYTRDKGLGVTVYFGQRRGHASTSDFSPQAIRDTVRAALSIARYTAEDSCAGLPEAELLAREVPDLDLYHPWAISAEEAVELARACEAAAFAVDPRIVNSEGATVATHESLFVLANSLGFAGGYPSSRHDISCAVIAESESGMQRDYWYESARDPRDLPDAAAVGRLAGSRTVRRLDPKKPKTMQVPVIFEAPVAHGLIAAFVAAVSGGNLYRKSSFLLDSLGQQVFAPFVRISERPHLPKGLASAPFDQEGVATRDREVVEDGVVMGYFLSSYSARKLGLRSTGNAGGCHNLLVAPGEHDLPGLLREMGRGLLVTELLGHGTNPVTGDYSRGAAGFWVEGGEIQYPVEEITVAGNLKEMYRDIQAIGKDVLTRGARQCGSIFVGRMTVAGE